MTYNVDTIRTQFPALAQTDNGMPRVFLDNPAGTQVPRSVVDAMSDCLLNSNANLGLLHHFEARGCGGRQRPFGDGGFIECSHTGRNIFGQNMTTLTLSVSRSIAHLLNEVTKSY